MKPVILLALLLSVSLAIAQAPNKYVLDASSVPSKPRAEHLKLGGSAPNGNSISVNSDYFEFNGKPWIPITAEFHYCRYPQQYWDESLKKMKAGGINTVATYVFWNVHEQTEGKFNWEGNNDLRKFMELCAKNDLLAIVRIGPFAHGEIRNGGLPDWLLGKPLTIRSNDPTYLSHVEKLYNKIGEQLKGLYFKDGGNIVGIQLENEYQHSAAPWGLTYPGQPHDMTAADRDLALTQEGVGIARENNPYTELGNDHMKILKEFAIKAGMITPLYTATGWGNAAIIPDETIPVTAAYAYPFWTPKKDISPFFLFKDMNKHPDYAPVRYKPEDYPVFPAELGSGIMTVYSRRPIAVHKSFDAMINRCLGSGANGVGYYMYHGGSTPHNGAYYFSDEAYGLPKKSYDFQAPIGEFGQVREGYQRLKLLHFFLNDFGNRLAPMNTVLPANAATLKSTNVTDLRYAVRSNGTSGFLFVNNFQDDTVMTVKKDLRFEINTSSGVVNIPASGSFDLQRDESVIFPFNFDLEGINLQYATAQLLTKGGDAEAPFYVFFSPAGIKPEFSFTGSGFSVKALNLATVKDNKTSKLVTCSGDRSEFLLTKGNKQVSVLVLTKETALKAYQITQNGKRGLVFSDNVVIPDNGSITLLSKGNTKFNFDVYPRLTSKASASEGSLSTGPLKNKSYSSYSVSVPEKTFAAQMTKFGEKKFAVALPDLSAGLNDYFLQIDYTGDTGMGFIDAELVTDEFFKGTTWDIGLRNILSSTKTREMVFYFRPVYSNATYLKDLDPATVPNFENKPSILKVNSVKFVPEYRTTISF
ncbi:glycosyl hydrolase family 35 [Pontibacter qinzhouensis]|uniref:Glycosyl hydrolase family 35 n=2 Tax=Pontibacter qinzhouensis TaxID=2603253 RepID=A0A5C8K260_9BACT|nr:glycosyl hydrolase family 35 [Pontibacter qinzhouensis]